MPGPSNTKPDDDSATESSDGGEHLMLNKSPAPTQPRSLATLDEKKADHSKSGSESRKEPQGPAKQPVSLGSSPPLDKPPPMKKAKQAISSSSDSDESDRAVAGPTIKRGAKQPVKPGARRF